VRTVVFRGWMQNPIRDEHDAADASNPVDSDVHLKFITDARSQKMLHGKAAEACWYFTETREQFRLRGEMVMVTHESTDSALVRQRSGLWKSISDSARAAYQWPAPGSTRSYDDDDEKDYRCSADIGTISDNFVMMLLRPNYIDHLRLKGFPQKRSIWSIKDDRSWETWNVNP
jgi:pyridoxamine 5'-phosphate oxidase